jgi:hypothetical protein
MIGTSPSNAVVVLPGALYVAWVAWSKFNRWPPDTRRKPKMPPRAYTWSARFTFFLGVYACAHLALFAMACLFPELVDALINGFFAPEKKSTLSAMGPGERTLFGSFVLTGVIPNIPVLKSMDHRARRWLHDRARIPGHAKALIEALIDESAFRPGTITYGRFLKQMALSLDCDPRRLISGADPILSRFAKLAFFANRLHRWESKPSKKHFLNKNCKLYNFFEEGFQSHQDRVRRYCTIDRTNPLLPEYAVDLDRNTGELLHEALEIICCGINRTTPTKAWHGTEFRFFSLYPELPPPQVLGRETITRTLVGIAAASLLTGMGTYFLHLAMHGTVSFIPAPLQTLQWTAYAILIHGLAITFVSLYHMSRTSYRQAKGYNPTRAQPLSIFQCVVGFLLGVAAGAFLFMTAHLVQQHLSPDARSMNMNVLCWTVCPGATGAFISYYIQSMRRLDLSWYWYALMQGLGTQVSVLLAAALMNSGTVLSGNRPFMLLAGFVVGATIGGIFPVNYKKRLMTLGMLPEQRELLPRDKTRIGGGAKGHGVRERT